MAWNTNKSKLLIKPYGYWAFALIMGIALIYIEQIDDIEPVFSILAFIYWSLLCYWAARWIFKQIQSVLRQKQEKNRIELLHLQSQVNPHFFFNTLNNLYGLVKKDSEKAQELILKLSDMMRYSIYEGQNRNVTIEEEIAYLTNYMELQKMRYHKSVTITFNKQIEESNYKVMPLLFILLVENAFKHGVENLRKRAFVTLDIKQDSGSIHFEITNNFDFEEVNKNTKGIGLINLKRRLEIGYPNKHYLSFSETDNVFTAELILKQ